MNTTTLQLTPRGKHLVKQALVERARNLTRSASGLQERSDSDRLREEAKEVQQIADVLGP